MENKNLEQLLAQSVDKARLTARQTGGKSNEALWGNINQKQILKNSASAITKKMGIIVALSITLAAAAMYSGFRYYKSNTAEVTSKPVPPIAPQHLARPHVSVSDTVLDEKPVPAPEPMVHSPVPPAPEPVLEPAPVITDAEPAPIQAVNEVIQQAADTAVVKQTVYKKPAPVTVQETKTKYVKRKRSDK